MFKTNLHLSAVSRETRAVALGHASVVVSPHRPDGTRRRLSFQTTTDTFLRVHAHTYSFEFIFKRMAQLVAHNLAVLPFKPVRAH